MKVLNSQQMKKIDRRAIEDIGLPGTVLMENAGLQVVSALMTLFPKLQTEKIAIVAGKGNNGGDGLVVARHLFNKGCDPRVLLLAAKDEVQGDAAVNLRIAERMGVRILEVASLEAWRKSRKALTGATLIIDAVFGTGLMKPADGFYAEAIKDINKTGAFVVAVDIPSGLSSDSPLLIGPTVRADLTVTLAAPKICHLLPPAEDYVGDLVIADICIPRVFFEDQDPNLELVEKKDLKPFFSARKKDTHKGTYGHLLIIAGSVGKTGAAIMAAKAALKTGAGLVTVGTPRSALSIIARAMPEFMTEPLPETETGTIASDAASAALELLKGKDALLIGPGISTHPSTAEFVRKLLVRTRIPVVIDADALNVLSPEAGLLKSLPKPAVLTPHPGEFGRLTGLSTKGILERRLELAPDFAKKHGVYLILKGYRTLTATPEGKLFINPTGNPGMATGGSGDVLSGMIASFLMQEKDLPGSILAAVYLHGLSGDVGAERVGERALVAGDLIRFLPQAFKEMSD